MKYIFVLITLLYNINALTFKANLKITENLYNIYNGEYIYSNDFNKILINYTNPINIIDLFDYNTNLSYKYDNSICNTFNINDNLPELFIKSTDNKYIIDEHINRYIRNNDFELYTYDNVLYKINFLNKNIVYEFSNYEEIDNYNFEINNICNDNIYNKNDIMNLIFVIDESENIIENDFNKQIDFIFDIISNYTIGINNVRIGLIGFSTFGRIILDLSYDFNKINSTLNYLKKTQLRGNNCIGCGLMLAYNMIEKNYKNNKISNHIILLTEDIINMPNYNNNCWKNTLTKYKYNYCFNNCDNNFYNNCDITLNNPSNISKNNVIIPIDYKYCKDYNNINYSNYKCINCECKKDIDDNYYLYCSNCYSNLSNTYSNCYNYTYYKICEVNNSIDYNENLTNSLNIIQNNNYNINLISIIKGYNLELFNNISIENYDELNYIFDFVINKINSKSISINNGCNIDCKGFCGLNGLCLCPECKNNNDDYCYNYKCNSDNLKSSGCYKEEIKCYNRDLCEYSIKNSNNPSCCEYISNSSNCDLISKCNIGICNKFEGCKTIPKDCDDNNPCTIDTCDNINGCVHTYNTLYNCSVEYDGLVIIKNCYKEGNICKPTIYKQRCRCTNICEVPVYNSILDICECKDKSIECNKNNNNKCLKNICVNGECKLVENITKTYECMDLVPEDGYAGFCNVNTGLCDRKQIGITHMNDLCYNFGCENRNTKCKRFKCENDNNYNVYCINYWNISLITDNNYIKDKCDDTYGLDRTIYNSYVLNCYNYTYNINTKKYDKTYLCPLDTETIKYTCYNNFYCIPKSQCPTFKYLSNLCLIFDRIENNECIYINKTCQTNNKCYISECEEITGNCIEKPINYSNSLCYNYICDNNTGIIQYNKYKFDDELCYDYYFYEENNECKYNKTLKCKSLNPCRKPICNLKNQCDTIIYNCDDYYDECFNYYCNEVSFTCEKKLRIDRFINYCDECVIKYGNLLNVNKSLCYNRLYPYYYTFSSSSSSSSSNSIKSSSFSSSIIKSSSSNIKDSSSNSILSSSKSKISNSIINNIKYKFILLILLIFI